MRKLILFIILCLICYETYSCSSFFINHGDQKFLCFSWDWPSDGDGYVFINQPNVNKKAFLLDTSKVLKWTSKFGNVSFNQIGAEFPYCGLNQAGLAIASMSNNDMRYPLPDNKRYRLNESQWIQYLLDNCATIEEVQKTVRMIQIIEVNAPIHYLIADKDGEVAVVEFVDGKLTFYKNSSLPHPVFTNSFYSKSLENYEKTLTDTTLRKKRFTKAVCALNDIKQTDTIDNYINYSFKILDVIEQGITKWQIVLDLVNLKTYFKSVTPNYVYLKESDDGSMTISDKKTKIKGRVASDKSEITSIDFKSIDFDCNNHIQFIDIYNHDRNSIDFKIYKENIEKKRIYYTIKLFKKLGFMRDIRRKSIKNYIEFTTNYTCQ